jgi:hypothetical protein
VKRVPELALRFVLSNPNVSVALSGMSEMKHVDENLATCAEAVSLTTEDRHDVEEHLARLKKMSDLYCSGCGYCKPCSSEVDISRVFGLYNQARTYGLWGQARNAYAGLLKKEKAADKCTECEECLEKCPQDIPIPERLKEAHAALRGDG